MKTERFAFRWPVKQISEHEIQVIVPDGTTEVLSNEFVKTYSLSEGEYDRAFRAVIRELAVIR